MDLLVRLIADVKHNTTAVVPNNDDDEEECAGDLNFNPDQEDLQRKHHAPTKGYRIIVETRTITRTTTDESRRLS